MPLPEEGEQGGPELDPLDPTHLLGALPGEVDQLVEEDEIHLEPHPDLVVLDRQADIDVGPVLWMQGAQIALGNGRSGGRGHRSQCENPEYEQDQRHGGECIRLRRVRTCNPGRTRAFHPPIAHRPCAPPIL